MFVQFLGIRVGAPYLARHAVEGGFEAFWGVKRALVFLINAGDDADEDCGDKAGVFSAAGDGDFSMRSLIGDVIGFLM